MESSNAPRANSHKASQACSQECKGQQISGDDLPANGAGRVSDAMYLPSRRPPEPTKACVGTYLPGLEDELPDGLDQLGIGGKGEKEEDVAGSSHTRMIKDIIMREMESSSGHSDTHPVHHPISILLRWHRSVD
jgi:hypothetical protein